MKKSEKISKKPLTKRIWGGIINKRSRERVENGPVDERARLALCKLNNTKKTRNPEILFEFESIFKQVKIAGSSLSNFGLKLFWSFGYNFLESLILAQDERWRRA